MKHQNVSYFAVGLFVLLMLGGLLAALFYISGRTGMGDEYFVYYEDVSGLAEGSPVTFRGFRVGLVSAMEPTFEGDRVRYRVTLSVRKGWPLNADSTARILTSGLLSSVRIDILGGTSDQRLKPGDTLAGREAVSLFAALDTIARQADRLVEEGALPVLRNLNARIDGIAMPLEAGAETIVNDLKTVSATLNGRIGGMTDDLDSLVASLNTSARHLEELLDEQNRGRVRDFLAKMDASAGNLQQLSEDLRGSRERLDNLLADSGKLVGDNRPNLTQATADLKASMATIAKNVDDVAYNLKLTSRNMAEFSRLIRQNPGLLLSGRGETPER